MFRLAAIANRVNCILRCKYVLPIIATALFLCVNFGQIYAQDPLPFDGAIHTITFETEEQYDTWYAGWTPGGDPAPPKPPSNYTPYTDADIIALSSVVNYLNDIVAEPITSFNGNIMFRKRPTEYMPGAAGHGGPGHGMCILDTIEATPGVRSTQIVNNYFEHLVLHELGHVLSIGIGSPGNYTEVVRDGQTFITFTSVNSSGTGWGGQLRAPDGSVIVTGQEYLLSQDNPFLFYGQNTIEAFGDYWYSGNVRGVAVDSNPDSIGTFQHPYDPPRGVMTYRSGRPFFSELELAILQDIGHTVYRDRFFGRSLYHIYDSAIEITNANNSLYTAEDGTTGWLGDGTFGVGLHVVRSDMQEDANAEGNVIRLGTHLMSTGYLGTGIRVEGFNHEITINENIIVGAAGEDGIGVLFIDGSGGTLHNYGAIYAKTTDNQLNNAVYVNNVLSSDGLNIYGGASITGHIFSSVTAATNLNLHSGSEDSTNAILVEGNLSGNFNLNFLGASLAMSGTIIDSDVLVTTGSAIGAGATGSLTIEGNLNMQSGSGLIIGASGIWNDEYIIHVEGNASIGNFAGGTAPGFFIDLLSLPTTGRHLLVSSEGTMTFVGWNTASEYNYFNYLFSASLRGTDAVLSSSSTVEMVGNELWLDAVVEGPTGQLRNLRVIWTGAANNIWGAGAAGPGAGNWRVPGSNVDNYFIDHDIVEFSLAQQIDPATFEPIVFVVDIDNTDGPRIVSDMFVTGNADWTFFGDVKGDGTGFVVGYDEDENPIYDPQSGGLYMTGTGTLRIGGWEYDEITEAYIRRDSNFAFDGIIALDDGTTIVNDGSRLSSEIGVYVGENGFAVLGGNGTVAAPQIVIDPEEEEPMPVLGGVWVYAGSALSPGDIEGETGNLTIDGDLVMYDYSMLLVDLFDAGIVLPNEYKEDPTILVHDTVTVTGDAYIGSIVINLSGLIAGNERLMGEYELILADGEIFYEDNSALLFLNGELIRDNESRRPIEYESFTKEDGNIFVLEITKNPENLFMQWTNSEGNGLWDFNSENWIDYDGPGAINGTTVFRDGDAVQFSNTFWDDEAGVYRTLTGNQVIDIVGDGKVVAEMSIYGSGNWTFNGNITGTANDDATTLTEYGLTGMLNIYDESFRTLTVTLNGDNTFEGGARLAEGTLILTGHNVFGEEGIEVRSGELYVGTGGEGGSVAGDIHLYTLFENYEARVFFNRSTDSTFTDRIYGSGSLTKRGSGELSLLGDNTYSGSTLIEQGGIIFGQNENSIGTVDVRGGALLSGVGNAPDKTDNRITNLTMSGAVNNQGEIKNFADFIAHADLSNNGGDIHNIETLRVHNITNTQGRIYDIGLIDLTGTIGGGEFEVLEDGSIVWNPNGTNGSMTGGWEIDEENGAYYDFTWSMNPDGSFSYTFVETETPDAFSVGPWVFELEEAPMQTIYGDFTNRVSAQVVNVDRLRAMNLTNAGDMVQIQHTSIWNKFVNNGNFTEFYTLTSGSVENYGNIIGHVNAEEESISTMNIAGNVINRPNAQIGVLAELTANRFENRGGLVGEIGNLTVAGELSNIVAGGQQGTIFKVGNIEADSMLNEGAMQDVGTMTVAQDIVNNGRMEQVGTITAGSLRSTGYLGHVNSLTVDNGIVNAGLFINVKEITAASLTMEYASVLGGTNHINLNGGTFRNNGGHIYVGDTGVDSDNVPFLKSMGILTIDGDLEIYNGVFEVGVREPSKISTNPMTNSVIDVSGTATINGGFVNIVVDKSQHYTSAGSEHRYTFLTAGNLDVNIDAPLIASEVDDKLLLAVADYNETDYWFVLQRKHLYSGSGETLNQREMGRYIDKVGIYPSGDYRNVLLALDYTRGGDEPVMLAYSAESVYTSDPIPVVFDQISGSIYGTMTTTSIQNTVMLHSTLTNVLRRDYNDVGGVYDKLYRGQEQRREPYGNRGIYNPTNNVWGLFYGHAGTIQSDGNAGKYTQGFAGIMAGFDRINEDRRRMGLFLSMGEGSLSGQIGDKTRTMEFMAGHYYRKDNANSYLLVQAGLGNHRYDTKRRLTFGGTDPITGVPYTVDRTAKNTHNSFLATAHVETGLRYRGGIFNLSPFVGAQYTALVREGFTERGANSLNLTTNMKSYDSLRTMFGMRFDSEAFRFRRGLASFYGNVAWMYEFEPNGTRHTEFTARFSDAGMLSGTPKFTVNGNDPGRDWVQAGFGLKHDIHAHLRGFIGYDAFANRNQVLHSGNIGFVWER